MNPQAGKIIKALNLQAHPEGGYFSEVYRSNEKANGLHERYSGNHVQYTSIYFLLNENDFSAFHRLKSDEIWHFYEGTALDIHIIGEDGSLKTVTLGKNTEEGEVYQYLVKRELYFAAEVKDKKSFTLAGCTVAPGFEYSDFEMPSGNELIKKYPQHEDIIKRLSKSNFKF